MTEILHDTVKAQIPARLHVEILQHRFWEDFTRRFPSAVNGRITRGNITPEIPAAFTEPKPSAQIPGGYLHDYLYICRVKMRDMATIIRKEEFDFQPYPNRIDGFRLYSDITRQKKDVNPQYLNFDMRELPPHQYNAAYHFHRFAEEMFLMLTGSATLRTPDGLTEVNAGDILFFEAGETGAHQLYNHTEEPCTYLDLRTYIGHDVCEYPDSGKLILMPGGETFKENEQYPYFEGETDVDAVWEKLRKK